MSLNQSRESTHKFVFHFVIPARDRNQEDRARGSKSKAPTRFPTPAPTGQSVDPRLLAYCAGHDHAKSPPRAPSSFLLYPHPHCFDCFTISSSLPSWWYWSQPPIWLLHLTWPSQSVDSPDPSFFGRRQWKTDNLVCRTHQAVR